MINERISEVITFLQLNYCRLANQELSHKEDEVKATIYDPQQPVGVVFNKIKLFQDLCLLIDNRKTISNGLLLVTLSLIIYVLTLIL